MVSCSLPESKNNQQDQRDHLTDSKDDLNTASDLRTQRIQKDDKKDDQDRQWYGECLPYEQCRLLCEGYSQSRDHSRIEEDHL